MDDAMVLILVLVLGFVAITIGPVILIIIIVVVVVGTLLLGLGVIVVVCSPCILIGAIVYGIIAIIGSILCGCQCHFDKDKLLSNSNENCFTCDWRETYDYDSDSEYVEPPKPKKKKDKQVTPKEIDKYNDECPICWEEFTKKTKIVVPKCGHAYCKACMEKLKDIHCPYCRGTMHGLPSELKKLIKSRDGYAKKRQRRRRRNDGGVA